MVNCGMAPKFDRCLRSNTAETPVKFLRHPATVTVGLVAAKFDELLFGSVTLVCFIETGRYAMIPNTAI